MAKRMEFTEYLERVMMGYDSHQRVGQQYFNELSNQRPDLTEKINGTELDPFYNSRRLPLFLTWVGDNWNKKD